MQIYQTKKEKIFKIIQIVYDILSALFIVFMSVSLAVGLNNGDKGSIEHLTPTIQDIKSRDNLADDETLNGWAFYSTKTHDYYQHWQSNATALSNYATINSTSGTIQYISTYTFSFIQLTTGLSAYNSLLFTFRSPQSGYIVVSKIQLFNLNVETGNWSNYLTIYDSTGPTNHTDYIIGVGSLVYQTATNNFITERYTGALLDFYLNRLAISSVLEDTFTFGDSFNPNFWLSLNVNNYNVITDYPLHTSYIRLPFVFVSNGYLFDQIQIVYNATYGVFFDNSKITYDNLDHITFDYMQYRYYGTDSYITTCAVPNYSVDYSSNIQGYIRYKMTNPSNYRWSNEGYKTLSIVSGLDNIPYQGELTDSVYNDPILNLPIKDILAYRGTYINDNTDIGLSNTFDLLSMAFGSVANIMAIQVLPNITIGLLVFLPLVVTIIIVIIRLVKK